MLFRSYPGVEAIARQELAGKAVPTTVTFKHRKLKQTIDVGSDAGVVALRKRARKSAWRQLAICLAKKAKVPGTRCNEEVYMRYPMVEWERRLYVMVSDKRPDVVRGAVLFGLNSGVSEIRAAVCKKVHRGMLANDRLLRDLIRGAANHPDPYTRLACARVLQGVPGRRAR